MAGFREVLAKAQLDAARNSAAQLAAALRDAEEAAAALNSRGPMTPQQAAAAEVKRLAAEARDAASAYKALAAAQEKALSSFSSGAPGATSPWATKPPANAAGGKAASQAKDSAKKAREAGDKEASKSGGGTPKDLKYLLKHAGVGKAAMGAVGAAGGLELTKLALGYRGMAQLSALTTRAGMQFRQLFRGVDPSPMVRAADRFFQLFNMQTAAGKALSGTFSNVFNGFFGAIERAQPYVSAFVKGLVIGALEIETSWYELRIAMLPVTNAIAEATTGVDGIGITAGVASAAFRGLAAGIQLTADAASALVSAYRALDARAKRNAMPEDVQIQLGNQERDEAQRKAAGEEASRARGFHEVYKIENGGKPVRLNDDGEAAGTAGATTGKAYADGLAKGAEAGTPQVDAAGQALAKVLDAGTRKAGQVHSPSKLAEETGKQFPAGTVRGIESGAGDVQAAAARAMVPRPGSGSATGTGPAVGAQGAVVHITHVWPEGVDRAKRSEIEKAAEAGDMRAIAIGLGVNVAAA